MENRGWEGEREEKERMEREEGQKGKKGKGRGEETGRKERVGIKGESRRGERREEGDERIKGKERGGRKKIGVFCFVYSVGDQTQVSCMPGTYFITESYLLPQKNIFKF